MTNTKLFSALAVLLLAFATGCSKVPDLTGMTQAQAQDALAKEKLQLGAVTVSNQAGKTPGTVLDQDPKPKAKIPDNKTIAIVLQSAPATDTTGTGSTTGNAGGTTTTGSTQNSGNSNLVSVPNLSGLSQNDAEAALNQLGLIPGAVNVVLNDKPAGKVFEQDPPAATSVPPGTIVNLSVSSDAIVAVPQVTGMAQAAAEQAIRIANLVPQSEPEIHPGADPNGNVFDQNPAQGLRVAKGQPVVLKVKQDAAVVPHVVGQTLQQAQIMLYQANLTPVVHYVLDRNNIGKVTGQTEPDNKNLAKGSPVGITVGQMDFRLIGRYEIMQRPQVAMSQTIQMNKVVSQFRAMGK